MTACVCIYAGPACTAQLPFEGLMLHTELPRHYSCDHELGSSSGAWQLRCLSVGSLHTCGQVLGVLGAELQQCTLFRLCPQCSTED